MFEDLGADHASWLLAAANNFLRQQRTESALVLLRFLSLFDPDNVQGQKLLAYALLLQDDPLGCRAVLSRLSRQRLTGRDRTAVELLNALLDEDGMQRQTTANRQTGR